MTRARHSLINRGYQSCFNPVKCHFLTTWLTEKIVLHKPEKNRPLNRAGSIRLLSVCLVLIGASVFLGCGDTYETAPAEELVFLPSDIFVDTCTDLGKAYYKSISSQGIYADENNWLRSWSHETYLWYDEIKDQDPSCCSTPVYFELMKTFETTASGSPKDKFHFTVPTAQFLANRQSIDIGYGAEFVLLRAAPPRDVRIAYTEPGSPATAPGVNLSRGAQILEVDGEAMLDSDNLDVLNNGLFPRAAGESHTFTVLDLGSSTPRTVTMTSEAITSHPVQNVKILSTSSGDRVGYMLFNAHNAPSATAVAEAGRHLKNAGIDDLIVDLRYNPGGLLYVAQIFSSMIAGTEKEGRIFEELQTNGKIPSQSWEFALEFSADDIIGDRDLTVPSLGVDIDVIRIGSVTCGKPYGFSPTENCGTVYHSINFRGVNAKGEADFEDGFAPRCQAAEDFNHQLGDPEEVLLKTALDYRTTGACPPSEEEGGRARVSSVESSSGEAISRPSGFSGKIVGSGMPQSN